MVLYIECNIDTLRERLLERAKTSGRADDNPETIEKRFKTFEEFTMPVADKYRKDHPRFVSVNGIGKVDEVSGRVKAELEKLALI